MKKITQQERVKEHERITRMTIARLLDYDEEVLNKMQFDTAYQYLRDIIGTEEYFPLTHEFWAWWRREWAEIDRAFVESLGIEWDVEKGDSQMYLTDRDNPKVRVRVANEHGLRVCYNHFHRPTVNNRFMNKSVLQACKNTIQKEVCHD